MEHEAGMKITITKEHSQHLNSKKKIINQKQYVAPNNNHGFVVVYFGQMKQNRDPLCRVPKPSQLLLAQYLISSVIMQRSIFSFINNFGIYKNCW